MLVDGLTEGAACTALLAKEYIDNDEISDIEEGFMKGYLAA